MDQFSRRQNNLCKAELIPRKVLTRLAAAAKLINPCRQSRQAPGPGSAGQPCTSRRALVAGEGARPPAMGALRDPWPRRLRTRRPAARRRRGTASGGRREKHPLGPLGDLLGAVPQSWSCTGLKGGGRHGMLSGPSPASAHGETRFCPPKSQLRST